MSTAERERQDPSREAHRRSSGALARLGDVVELAAGGVCVALFAAMIVVVFYEVVVRYVFNAPTFWSSELARYAMVWLVLLGMAIAVRRLEHIRVDVLVDVLPVPFRTLFAVLRYLLAFAFAGVLLIFGIELALQNTRQMAIGLGLPVFWLYLAAPVSAVLMIFFLIELVCRRETRPF